MAAADTTRRCIQTVLTRICIISASPDGHFRIQLFVEDELAEMYPKDSDRPHTSAAYVESKEGKRFRVEFDDCRPPQSRGEDLSVRLYIDGAL